MNFAKLEKIELRNGWEAEDKHNQIKGYSIKELRLSPFTGFFIAPIVRRLFEHLFLIIFCKLCGL